jgi:hypothetical protein
MTKAKKVVRIYMIRQENYLLTVNLKSELKTNAAGENQISQLSLPTATSWSKRLKIPSKSAN